MLWLIRPCLPSAACGRDVCYMYPCTVHCAAEFWRPWHLRIPGYQLHLTQLCLPAFCLPFMRPAFATILYTRVCTPKLVRSCTQIELWHRATAPWQDAATRGDGLQSELDRARRELSTLVAERDALQRDLATAKQQLAAADEQGRGLQVCKHECTDCRAPSVLGHNASGCPIWMTGLHARGRVRRAADDVWALYASWHAETIAYVNTELSYGHSTVRLTCAVLLRPAGCIG